MTAMAKIFKNGGSQAVRLPKEFRIDQDEVCIKRVGSVIMLYPKDKAWEIFKEALGKADKDFMADRNQPMEPEKRKGL